MKHHLRLTALALSAILLGGCGAREGEHLFVRTQAPEKTPITVSVDQSLDEISREGVRLFSRKLADLSEGTFSVSLIYEEDPFDSFEKGEAQVIFCDTPRLAQRRSEFSIYTSPFYFRDARHMTMTLNSPTFLELTDAEYREELGFTQLQAVYGGTSVFLSSNDGYIADGSDFQDLRVSMSDDPLVAGILEEFGARVTTKAFESCCTDFVRGSADAIEVRGEDLCLLPALSQEFVYLAETNHRIRVHWLLADAGAMEGYTPLQQAAIREASAYLGANVSETRQKQYEEQRDLLEQQKVEVTRLDQDWLTRQAKEVLYNDKEYSEQMDWERYDSVSMIIR